MYADALVTEGFEQCKVDDGVAVMTIGVYVDDLMVGGSQEGCESLLRSLKKTFPTNDLRECTWYDGCSIERNAELSTIKLIKEVYVESLITRFYVHTTSVTTASPADD